jgi:hypothetical protein
MTGFPHFSLLASMQAVKEPPGHLKRIIYTMRAMMNRIAIVAMEYTAILVKLVFSNLLLKLDSIVY